MLRFVTGNEGKLREARQYLDRVEGVEYDYPEIQAPSLEPIAAHGARNAYDHVGAPVLVDDAGLFVDALSGFPGPFSAYVEDTLGIESIRTLLDGSASGANRAQFRTVIAYCDGKRTETFSGSVRGRIVAPRGEDGFGYDPIFEHNGRTFAEMTPEEKNAVSHRGRALAAFAEWFAKSDT